MEKSGEKWGKRVLLGQYQLRVDEKGRAAVPRRLRREIGGRLIVTQGYENCLLVVSRDKWQDLTREVTEQPFSSGAGRDARRFLLGGAFEIELDGQGRFVIPPPLRDYAAIDEEVVWLGMGSYLEIWDLSRWQNYQRHLDEHIEKIAERLTQA
jgi:MraZ protein